MYITNYYNYLRHIHKFFINIQLHRSKVGASILDIGDIYS